MKRFTKLNYFIIGTFALFLSMPAIFGLILPKRTNSLIENRRLKDLPSKPATWTEFKEAPKEFDNYYADHFGFRWSLLFLHRHLKFFIKDSPLETVFFGNEDGWIFYNSKSDGDVLGDYRNINQFSKKELTTYVAKLKQKQKWLKNKGIEYLFVIAPSKHYIYPEKLPKYITRLNTQNLVSQLTQELKLHPEIKFIELAPKLISAKKNLLLYFKADSHWNYFGANIAQFEIAKKIKSLFPNRVTPILYPQSTFTEHEVQGELALIMGLGSFFKEKESVPNLDSCARNYTPNKIKYSQTFSTKCSSGGINAVIFRDSFFTDLQPFMSLYFDYSKYIWKKMSLQQLDNIINLEYGKPDLIIEEIVDRYLQ